VGLFAKVKTKTFGKKKNRVPKKDGPRQAARQSEKIQEVGKRKKRASEKKKNSGVGTPNCRRGGSAGTELLKKAARDWLREKEGKKITTEKIAEKNKGGRKPKKKK